MTFDDLFRLTPNGPDHWTAAVAPPSDERMVFGGLVIGQAILAASSQTRRLHALHAFFIGAGDKQQGFEVAVERTRDGGSFATRRFEIKQGERLLLAGYSSHHDGDDGPDHQLAMPVAPEPESLEDFSPIRLRRELELGRPLRHYLGEMMLDMRHVDRAHEVPVGGEASHFIWFRPRNPIQGEQAMHQAAIGFASDVGLVHAGLKQHAGSGKPPLQTASLDHSIWFHREVRADDWLLYVLRSPVMRNGRGTSYGTIFDREGALVASVAQEFLARSSKPVSTK